MNNLKPPSDDQSGTKLVGCAILGILLVAIVALPSSIIAMNQGDNYLAAGIMLLAASIGLGLLVNALLRH